MTIGRNLPGATTAQRSIFRRDVEGLRAVAIILVVFYHVHLRFFSGGYVGVDVFFVISGFLITGQLARELETHGRISLLGFYARRARRILPAATLVLIVTAVASARVLAPLAARRALHDVTAAVFFGVNFRLASEGANYFDNDLPPSPVQHFWSLSVEEQFYIAWPLLLILSSLVWLKAGTSRRRRSQREILQSADGSGPAPSPFFPTIVAVLGAVAVASFLASVHQTPSSPSWAYYSIVTRAWELAVGALAALALPLAARLDRRLAALITWTGLAAIVLATVTFNARTVYPGSDALLPVAGAAAIVLGGSTATRRWGAEALLGTAPFQRVGSWSYSWYLWHWPALILAPAMIGHALSVNQALLVALVSLGIAILSFVLVERPIRRMQFVVRRPALGLGGGVVLLACSLTAVVASASSIPALVATGAVAVARPALPPSGQLTAAKLAADLVSGVKTTKVPSNVTPTVATAAKAVPLIVSNGCHLQHAGTKSKPCIYGDTTSTTSVVLFGDSHAAAWFPALEIVSKQQHWRLVDISKAGCPPVEVGILYTGTTLYKQCAAWRANAMAQISALHPLLVIADWARYNELPEALPLAGVPTGYGSAWLNGVAAIFNFLHRAAQHTIFMSDTPTLTQLAPDCVSAHLSDVAACTTATTAATRFPTVKRQELALAQRTHINAIDPESWFCTPTRCPVIVGNIFLYRDNAHMTPAWSDFIEPVFAAAILPMVKAAKPAG